MQGPSITRFLKSALRGKAAHAAVRRHQHYYVDEGSGEAVRRSDAAELNRNYYDLVTDIYEYAWGPSFHFAARRRAESFPDSIVRHELYLAERAGLNAEMKVLDLGCGIGGPMRNIGRATGAHIIGVNNNAYQVQRGLALNAEAGLVDRLEFIECDWMHMPVEPGTFDAAYSVESSCIAGDRVALFREVHRVLKDGAPFVGYEYCLTERYDPSNAQHRRDKAAIEQGAGLPALVGQREIEDAIRRGGFELMECRDLAPECDAETPWYLPLKGEGMSVQALRRSHMGGLTLQFAVSVLERVGVLPRGARAVIRMLRRCGDAMVRTGAAGVFTPMLFFEARKAPR